MTHIKLDCFHKARHRFAPERHTRFKGNGIKGSLIFFGSIYSRLTFSSKYTPRAANKERSCSETINTHSSALPEQFRESHPNNLDHHRCELPFSYSTRTWGMGLLKFLNRTIRAWERWTSWHHPSCRTCINADKGVRSVVVSPIKPTAFVVIEKYK